MDYTIHFPATVVVYVENMPNDDDTAYGAAVKRLQDELEKVSIRSAIYVKWMGGKVANKEARRVT
jgi:hypothetical protein